MSFPASWARIPVTATYLLRDDSGTPATGRVEFRSAQIVVADGSIIVPVRVTATLDSAGKISLLLPATDDPDIQPNSWTWSVTEIIDRQPRRTYSLAVPHTASSIDLSSISPIPPGSPVYDYLLTSAIGVTVAGQGDLDVLDGRVTALEGAGGGVQLSDATPSALGSASAGVGTEASRDDHVHAMPTAAQVGAEVAGAVSSHEAASDPHPQYTTWGDAGAAAPVQSVAGRTGAVTLTHTDIGGLGDSATRNVGTAAGTVAAGDDARLSDARTPTAHTHPSTDISDSTATGRAVLTAADAAAASAAIGALPLSGGVMTGAITGNVGGVTDFIQLKVDGSTFSEPVQDFMFTGRLFSGVNLPGGSSLPNCVYNIGWGIGANGAPLVAGQPGLRIAFEQNFINPGDVAAYEWHLSYYDTTGYEHRPISAYLRKDGSRGSDMALNNDILGFNDGRHVQKIKYDFLDNDIFHAENMSYMFSVNNYPALRQMNAAGNGYIDSWYVDDADMLRAGAPIWVVGSAPTTGPYPGNFSTLQCNALPNNGHGLSVITPGGNYEHNGVSVIGGCQQALKLNVWNNSGAAAGAAVLNLRTLGAAAGDPFIRYTINGVTDWAVGIDNSDDDAFVWSDWPLGGSNRMRLSLDGNLSLPQVGGGLRVKEGDNCKQGTATLVAGTVTVANTSVTANSRIFLTGQADGGTPGFVRVSSRVPGTSFTITSSSGTDTSTVAYEIFEPA